MPLFFSPVPPLVLRGASRALRSLVIGVSLAHAATVLLSAHQLLTVGQRHPVQTPALRFSPAP